MMAEQLLPAQDTAMLWGACLPSDQLLIACRSLPQLQHAIVCTYATVAEGASNVHYEKGGQPEPGLKTAEGADVRLNQAEAAESTTSAPLPSAPLQAGGWSGAEAALKQAEATLKQASGRPETPLQSHFKPHSAQFQWSLFLVVLSVVLFLARLMKASEVYCGLKQSGAAWKHKARSPSNPSFQTIGLLSPGSTCIGLWVHFLKRQATYMLRLE